MSKPGPSTHLFQCRAEFAGVLRDELADLGHRARVVVPGLVAADGLPAEPLIFEHQRLPDAHLIPLADLKPISDHTWRSIMGAVLDAQHRWTLHAGALPNELQPRVTGVANTLLRLARKLGPALDDLERPPHRAERMDDALVLQLCLTPEGLWHSTAPMASLSSRQPGGEVRMKDDPQAPSRSFLKVEEAFYCMNEWPQPGQRVVDLGAAPGGWTLAFAKRGCAVAAVDNGALKLPPPGSGWGPVEHLKRDGLSFALPADTPPVDWLVADMLVPPGCVVSLLRNWLKAPAMKRFVVNMKLPEGPPLGAIRPLQELLAQHPNFQTKLRHLYHDREEITVMGRRLD